MKIARLKTVTSAQGFGISIRGPMGRGHNDAAQKHITAAGFVDGEDVVLITAADFEKLTNKEKQ